jgi:hypothetical protein
MKMQFLEIVYMLFYMPLVIHITMLFLARFISGCEKLRHSALFCFQSADDSFSTVLEHRAYCE